MLACTLLLHSFIDGMITTFAWSEDHRVGCEAARVRAMHTIEHCHSSTMNLDCAQPYLEPSHSSANPTPTIIYFTNLRLTRIPFSIHIP